MSESDIRRFFQGGGDSERREVEKKKSVENKRLEKRKQSQKDYDTCKRKRLTVESWFEEFPWLEKTYTELFCSVCRKYPTLSDPESTLVKGIKENYRKETLKFHDKSQKHIKWVIKDQVLNTPNQETELTKSIKNIDKKNGVIYEKLFSTAYYIAKEDEPLSKYPKLLELQRKNGVTVGTNYLNEMACKMFINCISQVMKEEMSESLQNTRFISILFDGSTDKSIVEQEIIYVRYINHLGILQTQMADIIKLEHGHAVGVKNGVLEGLKNVGMSPEILKQKLVGINTDGASVNLGKKNGAVKLLKDVINEQMNDGETCDDYIAVVHCIAHNLELAVCDAKKDIGYLNDFENVLKGVFQLYYYSPKHRRELYDIATYLDKDLKHYGGLKAVRWVASQNRALKSLLENYEVTIIHLEEITNGRDDNANKSRYYIRQMKTERFLMFLHFLIDWTNLLSEVSVLFQSKKALVSEVARRVRELKEKVVHMKVRRGKMLRSFLHESADGLFKGVEITQRARQRDGRDEVDIPDPVQIYNDIDQILSTTETFLDERFIKHLGGEPHSLFNIFDFHQWPDSVNNSETFRQYGQEEIEQLVRVYSPLLNDQERENAAEEWLDLKMYIDRNKNRGLIDVYECLLGNRDIDNMKHILTIINIMLTISPTTAECERGFSHMNLIKKQSRVNLKQDTLSSLMRIKLDGPSVDNFNSSKSVVNWLNSGRGTKHILGHKCQVRQEPEPGPSHVISDTDSDSSS